METNLKTSGLLQSMQIKSAANNTTQQQQQIQQTAPLSQPAADTFNSSQVKNKIPAYIKDYGGLAAIALTVAGLPVTYKLAKGKTSKQLKELQKTIETLNNQFSEKGIQEKISEAVKNAANDLQKRTNPISAKSALTGALLALGSVFGVKEYVKNSKEDLVKKGYSEEEIKDAEETASSILSKAENAEKKADSLSSMANEAKAVAYESRNI